jgi:hypothetical protein
MSINASLIQAFLNDTSVFSENESTKIPTDTILGGTAMGVSGLTFLGLVSYVLYRKCKTTKNNGTNDDASVNDDATLTAAAVATAAEVVNKVEKQGLISFVTSFFTRKSTEKTQNPKKDLENQNEPVSSNQVNLSESKAIPGFITIKD